jgi:hypothetical protein
MRLFPVASGTPAPAGGDESSLQARAADPSTRNYHGIYPASVLVRREAWAAGEETFEDIPEAGLSRLPPDDGSRRPASDIERQPDTGLADPCVRIPALGAPLARGGHD